MFAARDQENLVHARQTTAAGKPLNQGIRTLQPKTPGHAKTPFQASRRDENQPFLTQGQKTLLKGGDGKLNHNPFVTPAATKSRAVLGAKTANTKAQPLKTPGPGQTIKRDKPAKQLSSTRRSIRKITVAPTEFIPAPVENEVDDEPEFGYAPPPIQELPDPPLDLGYDQDFPQFRPENMFRGYGEIYFGSPKDESGLSIRRKQEEENDRLSMEREQKLLLDSITKMELSRSDPDAEVDAMIAAGPKTRPQPKESKVNTFKARSAVDALSVSTTARTKASSINTSNTIKKSTVPVPRPVQPSSKAPFSVSKNTIGFPKARQAPSIIPRTQQRQGNLHKTPANDKPIAQKDIHPLEFVKLYGQPPVESDMWIRLKQHELLQQESQDIFDLDDDLLTEREEFDLFAPTAEEDDDVFQLPVPED